MRKVEGESFEEQWKNALNDAEMGPPDKLWTAIDGELANIEAAKLRKQMVWYRGIAAALLLLILSSLVIAWQLDDSENLLTEDIRNTEKQTQNNFTTDELREVYSNDLNFNALAESGLTSNNDNLKTTEALPAPGLRSGQEDQQEINIIAAGSSQLTLDRKLNVVSIAPANNPSKSGVKPVTLNQSPERSYAEMRSVSSSEAVTSNSSQEIITIASKGLGNLIPLLENDPYQAAKDQYYQGVILYDFDLKAKHLIANNQTYSTNSWADFNVRGGVFEPNYQLQQGGRRENFDALILPNRRMNLVEQQNQTFDSNSVNSGEDLTAGYSYSMNLSYGKRIAKRFFLQSGLEYGIYEAVASTNKVLSDGFENRVAVTEQIIVDGDVDLDNGNYGIGFENVKLNNSFQFATVPVKFGYTILDKNLTLSVSSGINTGFYLGNSLSDPDRNLDEITVSRSDNTLYRDVNFSAVGSISIGYRLLDNYLFTLEPTYQRAINSFTRENSNFTALPENFGISAGVRVFIQ